MTYTNSTPIASSSLTKNKIWLAVMVAALGYFVDVFDIAIFGIVRMKSLKDMGVSGDGAISTGVFLLNCQMAGMLIGGLAWGILGDKLGRLQVLFGSIFVYSVATLLNGFADSVSTYAILRFIAGFGLSGEVGAGITLVSELMPKEKRGIGTTIVATVGVSGAVVSGFVGDYLPWREVYMVGGALGFCLLLLRISVHESGMFNEIKSESSVRRGDLRLFLTNKSRLRKFVCCVLVGLPVWFANGVLVAFSPEIAAALGISGITSGQAVIYFVGGAAVGDLASGLISQAVKSRIIVLRAFLIAAVVFTMLTLTVSFSATSYLMLIAVAGFFIGYWAVFIATAAEQFGTNLRSTVAVSIPNFVRGSTLITVTLFNLLRTNLGIINSAEIVGLGTFAIAIVSLTFLKETYGIDLNFIEDESGTRMLTPVNEDTSVGTLVASS